MRRSCGEWFRYRFDNIMSRGAVALIGLLGLATVLLVVVVTGLVWVFRAFPGDEPDADFIDVLWGSLLRTLDPGTMGGDTGWGFRILMLVITIGGLIVVASLISIISGAFDAKVEDLRKGRSRVLEKDHTLVLGWNSKIHSIIQELAIANQSRGRASIVVLAPRDKVEMDDFVHSIAGLGRTRVICRTGDPKSPGDLAIVSPDAARSIVVLAPEGAVDADAEVVKVVLALVHNPRRERDGYHVVAELGDSANLDVARMVGRDEVGWLLSPELIARIVVQTCRQSGMSAIYSELLDFEGDELYFSEQPSLVGRSYHEAQTAFPKCAVIGLVRAGQVTINPAPDTVIAAGDQVIVIAEDDSTINLGEAVAPAVDRLVEVEPADLRPEKILVLGVNANLPLVLGELDTYVAPGSAVRIVTTASVPQLPRLANLEVSVECADPTRRAVLASLDLAGFEHVLVLADAAVEDRDQADSRTLVTLLQLRDLCAHGSLDVNIVSEMIDDANRELAEVTHADDFIVSDRLIALLLAQVSENRQLLQVFSDLLSSEGSEIYLNPVTDYVQLGRPVDFYTVLEAARRRGETAIGYRVAALAHSSADGYGIRLNPLKSDPIAFAAADRLIVLALGA